jgi:hypothetical protein
MKMVKSLLLGSAAGVVAMAGAQAADLPVKAKPVQYVKICSLYGAGFYYIPGTDTCLKVGGWVRMQFGYNYNGNMSNGPLASNLNNRSTNDFMTRNRGYITADARTQSEYGTLRAYIAVGLSNDNPIPGMATSNTAVGTVSTGAASVTAGSQGAVGFSANRAFVQFAGFTAGLAQSFYDFTDNSALSYNGATAWYAAGTTTGDPGWQVLAYTAAFGGGMSASLSLENPRNVAVSEYSAIAAAITPVGSTVSPTTFSGKDGNKYPDVVANLRMDATWGSAQIMGAIHDASATYDTASGGSSAGAFTAGSQATHPSNATGWAVGGGVKILFPMIGPGDYFDGQIGYAVGATKYVGAAGSLAMTTGATSGKGTASDGIYLDGTGTVNLTTAWGAFGGYQHYWNTKWKTSLYGGYTKTMYNSAANAIINSTAAVAAGANANWGVYEVGTRTAWAPVPNLEVGVDVMYSYLQASNLGTDTTAHAIGSTNQSAWTAHLRVQRNFYP